MQFKVDENLPREACRILRNSGRDAVSVWDQQLGGYPDADIAAVCKSESRILVTLDADFSNILAYPPKYFSGIIVIRAEDQSKSVVLEIIHRIVAFLESESPQGDLWIAESNRIRIRGSK